MPNNPARLPILYLGEDVAGLPAVDPFLMPLFARYPVRFIVPPLTTTAALAALNLATGVLVAHTTFHTLPADWYGGIPRARPLQSTPAAVALAIQTEALSRDLPILAFGIGAQILAVASGGTLSEPHHAINPAHHIGRDHHPVRHLVFPDPGAEAITLPDLGTPVTSCHTDQIASPGPGFRPSAHAADLTIEAFERIAPFAAGLQWLPDPSSSHDQATADRFVNACRLYHLHRRTSEPALARPPVAIVSEMK
jgi:gamma-glutamyl-gamma-aminobutyrate hydrolase PuuD